MQLSLRQGLVCVLNTKICALNLVSTLRFLGFLPRGICQYNGQRTNLCQKQNGVLVTLHILLDFFEGFTVYTWVIIVTQVSRSTTYFSLPISLTIGFFFVQLKLQTCFETHVNTKSAQNSYILASQILARFTQPHRDGHL